MKNPGNRLHYHHRIAATILHNDADRVNQSSISESINEELIGGKMMTQGQLGG
jgi:hypothetical protein